MLLLLLALVLQPLPPALLQLLLPGQTGRA
jgi:hypothetical protein